MTALPGRSKSGSQTKELLKRDFELLASLAVTDIFLFCTAREVLSMLPNLDFVAFCNIKLVHHSKDYVIKFEKEVTKLKEVLECYHISGDYDYLLKVLVKDMEAFREFMVKKLTSIDHIGSTHSTFMISEVKHTTAFSLEAK